MSFSTAFRNSREFISPRYLVTHSVTRSEEDAAIGGDAPHADSLVEPDRSLVLRTDEEGHGRGPLKQEPAEVGQPARSMALPPRLRIDPDLLELDGPGRPRRGLRLEQDRALLDPEPRAPLLDLRDRAPAEADRVMLEWVDAELLEIIRRADGEQEIEVVERRF